MRQFIPSGGIRVHYYSSVKVYLTTFGTCGASARRNESDQYCESLLMPHVIIQWSISLMALMNHYSRTASLSKVSHRQGSNYGLPPRVMAGRHTDAGDTWTSCA